MGNPQGARANRFGLMLFLMCVVVLLMCVVVCFLYVFFLKIVVVAKICFKNKE